MKGTIVPPVHYLDARGIRWMVYLAPSESSWAKMGTPILARVARNPYGLRTDRSVMNATDVKSMLDAIDRTEERAR